MILKGKLFAETPIYRGNARKTMFTRDGDGKYKLVSLAGEISGTAQALMDAFTGKSRNGKNIGLLEQLWNRLYGEEMPNGLIRNVECKLRDECYPRDKFFDLRMGIKLDEDRWAAESNANYKMETLFKNSAFDFSMTLNDAALKRDDTSDKLYYLLQEMVESRFWFGAGKSKGLGRLRLEAKLPFSAGKKPTLQSQANHLRIDFSFDSENPVLVGWNWGKVDPNTPSFVSMDAALLLENMTQIPSVIRERLKMSLGGAMLNPDEWKEKFLAFFPRSVAIWLKEKSEGEMNAWLLTATALKKMSKGKYALSKKVVANLTPIEDQPFASKEEAEEAITQALGNAADKFAKRVIKQLSQEETVLQSLNEKAWSQIAENFGFDDALKATVSEAIGDEAELTKAIEPACKKLTQRLFQQVDQQMKLTQSDTWVDAELQTREEHLQIKMMLMDGSISEDQWSNPQRPPEGIRAGAWKEFLHDHSRVAYRHMLNNRNLQKSITNDQNQIAFLKSHRDKTRVELARPEHIDFRTGGPSGRHISKAYGKPYDTLFMRMLSWAPSTQEQGAWEIYIPGGTIKGAFRKRASQLLNTLWGEGKKTQFLLDDLFGTQGRRGMAFFSDAYLSNPDTTGRWCSMDGVCMDPKTGQPVESSKADYLFAYGNQLKFEFQIDVQDIDKKRLSALYVLIHLINDFRRGDIPIGGQKSSGFGWVTADLERLQWLTAGKNAVHGTLFKDLPLTASGPWQMVERTGDDAETLFENLVTTIDPILPEKEFTNNIPHAPKIGFVSHRAFGGCCGQLVVEAELLTPTHIQESGEPSYTTEVNGEPINGFDFFSLSSPEAGQRDDGDRIYALPSKSIKGMVRHIYTIASNAGEESKDISRLNPADSLFGWVGTGPNQALMGRLAFEFAKFDTPAEMAWFKVPYPYGDWSFDGSTWKQKTGGHAKMQRIADTWRLFPHAPLAPIVEKIPEFAPDGVQARYLKAMLPGNKAQFTIRFWNLEVSELQRLVWALELEKGLAHKMGNNRYLGFGSVKLTVRPESYLIDWAKRYAGKPASQWQLPLEVDRNMAQKAIQNYPALKKALDAQHI